MSILTTSCVVGQMNPDAFMGIEHLNDYSRFWVSDPFTVEQSIANDRLELKVVFKTLTGEIVFDWDMTSLRYLTKSCVLIDTLIAHGIRVSMRPEAVHVILDAIQNPNLIIQQKEVH